MDSTVAVAAMGFVATIGGVALSAYWQRSSAREAQMLAAQVQVYGACVEALHEYERVMFSRVRARIEQRPDAEREALRQEAYRCDTRARSAIGQAIFLSGDEGLDEQLDDVRDKVEALNRVDALPDLWHRHDEILKTLRQVLSRVRKGLPH
ncbi:hypothetical protein ACIA49_09175 [Kribbella sp. NPDC051587]|uniref:hypothetical protein n=1 Tax=Kribbella sp. NPDC051587 TaxID=3364119 RepID=UPI003788219E